MSWLQKLLPPKIKRSEGARKSIPEGLWTKCPACEAVLYSTDLESNQNVCPKCGHHHRLAQWLPASVVTLPWRTVAGVGWKSRSRQG